MILIGYEAAWVRYFTLTTLTELAVAVPLLSKQPLGRRVLAVLVANFATHHFVWFFLARLGMSRLGLTLVAEPWAVGFETLVYALAFPALPRSRALAASALANAASFVVGLLVARLL